jgi:hypothetical protein
MERRKVAREGGPTKKRTIIKMVPQILIQEEKKWEIKLTKH